MESLEASQKAVEVSSHEIDAVHQPFKRDTWAGGTRAKPLVDLVNEQADVT